MAPPAMAATNGKSVSVSVATDSLLPDCGGSDLLIPTSDPTDEDDCPNLIAMEKEEAAVVGEAAAAASSVDDGSSNSENSETDPKPEEVKKTEAKPEKVTQETQTETSPVSREALQICLDVVDLALRKDQDDCKQGDDWQPRSDASATMFTLVNDILNGHSIVYKSMVEKLELARRSNFWAVKSMCDEVFRGGEVSWGRIIAVYAVCAQLAITCKQQSQSEEMAYNMADTIGTYVGTMADEWISQKGGWDSLKKEFPPKDALQTKVWRGLLMTGLGLGMFATFLKAIR